MAGPRTRARVQLERKEIARVFEVRARFLALPCDPRYELYKRAVRDDPRLPPGWKERRSRSSGRLYFCNAASHASQWVFPVQLLPPGWSVEESHFATAGVRYFAHAGTKMRQWSFPRADAQWMLPASMPRR